MNDERELTYYCTPRDLAGIDAEVFRRLGGSLIETEKRWPTHRLVPVKSFALDQRDMGTGSLFLFLIPPADLQRHVFAGPWLDQNRSHVIEAGRCLVNRKVILGARLWCSTADKPRAFVHWAGQVFEATRQMLECVTHAGRHVWIGHSAQEALRSDELRIV